MTLQVERSPIWVGPRSAVECLHTQCSEMTCDSVHHCNEMPSNPEAGMFSYRRETGVIERHPKPTCSK